MSSGPCCARSSLFNMARKLSLWLDSSSSSMHVVNFLIVKTELVSDFLSNQWSFSAYLNSVQGV